MTRDGEGKVRETRGSDTSPSRLKRAADRAMSDAEEAGRHDAEVLTRAARNAELVVFRCSLALQQGIKQTREQDPATGQVVTKVILLGDPFDASKVSKICAEANAIAAKSYRVARGLDQSDDEAKASVTVNVHQRADPEEVRRLAAMLPPEERAIWEMALRGSNGNGRV